MVPGASGRCRAGAPSRCWPCSPRRARSRAAAWRRCSGANSTTPARAATCAASWRACAARAWRRPSASSATASASAPTSPATSTPSEAPPREGDGAAALVAWRGHFLDGFDLADAAAFREWLGEQRGRLIQRWRELVAQQAARCEAAGDARAALDWHARLVDDDPLQELHHVNVMRLHHLLGERRPALAAWERCREVLRDELGIAPSPATVALAEQIRSPERLSSLALRRADAALRRIEAPFVGRAAEMAGCASAAASPPSCSKAKPASARRGWRRKSCARDRRSPSAARRSPARRRCMPSPRRCARSSRRPSGWPASTASAPTTGAK